MLFKILKKDFLKKKAITLILLVFVVLSAFLVASGFSMITRLSSSLNSLFLASSVPDFVQLQSGAINPAVIDHWASSNSFVKKSQIVQMLNVDGSHIYLGNAATSESQSVMSMDFVTQNTGFDFLLNLQGQRAAVQAGQIAVPVYFMQENHLKIGDSIKIATPTFTKTFTIVAFVRDALMNPSIIHSKRFVINPIDFQALSQNISELGQVQYLIEFQLTNLNDLKKFSDAYQQSDMPKNGPTLDYQLFKVLNSVTDGVVIGILILLSLLLTIVALLCLRFTILAALEEDYRQIGVMKAIGIPQSYIRNMYLVKYVALAAVAGVIGYVGSLCLGRFFISNILLYLGSAPASSTQQIAPLLAVLVIFCIVVGFCLLVLRRFKKISALKALQDASIGDQSTLKRLPICMGRRINLNVFLGLRDVLQRFRLFILLFFVFFIGAFIAIVPINFLNTIQSSSFITYMGVGHSDIRIDLQQGNATAQSFQKIEQFLQNDPDVSKYACFTTARFKMLDNHHALQNINIETGDFSKFPLQYLKGDAPAQNNQIALSYLNSNQLQKKVGDTVDLLNNGSTQAMTVSGIYQDVTNGGLTAKALLSPDPANILWYVINIDLKPGVNVQNKVSEYNKLFAPARVTGIHDYLSQTLGDLISQIKAITILAVLIALFVSALIVSLFLKMLVAKDYRPIAILKAIGFSEADIRTQYLTRALFVLVLGIVLGTILSNTLGQALVGVLWSFMGAPAIHFILVPVEVYLLCPLILIVVVAMTAFFSLKAISKVNIAQMLVE